MELWRRAASADGAVVNGRGGGEEGGFELIYSEQQRRCEGRLLSQQRTALLESNPCRQLTPFT